jgi:hypothetical protein
MVLLFWLFCSFGKKKKKKEAPAAISAVAEPPPNGEDDIRDVADYSAEEQAAALGIQNRFRGR